MTQFLRLWTLLEEVQLQPDVQDQMVWRWTADGSYSCTSAYHAFFEGRIPMRGAKELWATSCPPKVKFFFWIALHGRLWTAERRKRHGLQDNDACTFCDQHAEDTDHLLLACPYSREIWLRVLQHLGLQRLAPQVHDTLLDLWLGARSTIPATVRRGLDSAVLLTAWMVWKERNRRTFDGIASSPAALVRSIKDEADDWEAADHRALAVFLAR